MRLWMRLRMRLRMRMQSPSSHATFFLSFRCPSDCGGATHFWTVKVKQTRAQRTNSSTIQLLKWEWYDMYVVSSFSLTKDRQVGGRFTPPSLPYLRTHSNATKRFRSAACLIVDWGRRLKGCAERPSNGSFLPEFTVTHSVTVSLTHSLPSRFCAAVAALSRQT